MKYCKYYQHVSQFVYDIRITEIHINPARENSSIFVWNCTLDTSMYTTGSVIYRIILNYSLPLECYLTK